MKNTLKYILQKTLGFERYLYVFSKFKIYTLKNDKNEKDFFHFISLIKDGKGDLIDIGANIGIMTYYFSKQFPNCKVHSIEPIPVNFKVLKRISAHYKLTNVMLYNIAFGQNKGVLKMILPYNGKTKMQGLSHVKHESIPDWNEGKEFDVSVDTLDELFLNENIQAIKIDVENYEFFAFQGGEQFLRQRKPLIYAELWENENRDNSFNLLKDLGYSIFVIENEQLVPFIEGTHCTQNFIFKQSSIF